jgi:hypothetical protein
MGISEWSVNEFLRLEELLKTEYPTSYKEAQNLAANIVDPSEATIEEIWHVLWPKPFYSARYVDPAEIEVEFLKSTFEPNLAKMKLDDPEFGIRRKTNVKQGQAMNNDTFFDYGTTAYRLCVEGNTAKHRFYAAVSSGQWLNQHYSDLPNIVNELSLQKCIAKLEKELGHGWGHISVMHFLTDLGVCCKPDVRLIEAVREIGIYTDTRDPITSQPAARAVFEAVNALVNRLYGTSNPQKLRYVDKILMEISRQILKTPEK